MAPSADEGCEIAAIGLIPPGINAPCIAAGAVCFKDSIEEALAALAPFKATRPPGAVMEIIDSPTSMAQQYREQDEMNPTRASNSTLFSSKFSPFAF